VLEAQRLRIDPPNLVNYLNKAGCVKGESGGETLKGISNHFGAMKKE
jgi:hypothetical protein